MNEHQSLLDYKNPPVVEVVCGVLFKPIKEMLAPHLGILWEQFRSEYPNCQEMPPLSPVIEQFEDDLAPQFEITNLPPLPRIWFMDENQNKMIQVQRDRFHSNWRKIRPDDEYPRYPKVLELFQEHLFLFDAFINENGFPSLSPLQYELTYVNHIDQGKGWDSTKDVGLVFPDFDFRKDSDRFLPEPETFNWITTFALPEKLGRLHQTIRYVKGDESEPAKMVLNSTVRGIGQEKILSGLKEWFDVAREWIVYSFADSTSKEIQEKIWQLKS